MTRFFQDQMVLAQYLVDTKALLEKPLPFYLIWKPGPPEKKSVDCVQLAPKAARKM